MTLENICEILTSEKQTSKLFLYEKYKQKNKKMLNINKIFYICVYVYVFIYIHTQHILFIYMAWE